MKERFKENTRCSPSKQQRTTPEMNELRISCPLYFVFYPVFNSQSFNLNWNDLLELESAVYVVKERDWSLSDEGENLIRLAFRFYLRGTKEIDLNGSYSSFQLNFPLAKNLALDALKNIHDYIENI